MQNPFKYLPADPDDGWEDNPVSNTLAWLSEKLLPTWCKAPDHWTVKLVLYLWADCSCCLFFRGVTLGTTVALPIGLVIGYLAG